MKKVVWLICLIIIFPACAMTLKNHQLFSQAREEALRHNLPIVLMVMGQPPNSAGGIDIEIGFENVSTETLRSVTFTLTVHDEQGKPLPCEVRQESGNALTATGPFRTGKYYLRIWNNVWYSKNIQCFEINSVAVTFLDLTTRLIDKPEELNKIVIADSGKTHTHKFIFWGEVTPGTCEPRTGGSPVKN